MLKLRYPRFGLRLRIILLSLVSIAPIVALEVHNARNSVEHNLAEAHERARALVGEANGKFDNPILEAQTLVTLLASDPDILELRQPACNDRVVSAAAEYPFLTGVYVVGTDGQPVCYKAMKQSVNIADKDYFQKALATRALTISGFHIGLVSHKPIISLLKPVVDAQGNVTRMVGTGINLGAFSAMLDDHDLSEGASITVIDDAGVVIGRYPDADKYLGQNVSATPVFQSVLEHDKGEIEATGLAGDERIFAFQPFAGIAAHIVVGIPKQPIIDNIHKQLYRTLMALAAIIAACAIVGIVVSEMLILRPTRAVTEAASAIINGDFAPAERVRKSSMREINTMLKSFRSMAIQLRQREDELKASEAQAVEMNRKLLLGEQIANVGYWRLDVKNGTLAWSHGVYHVFDVPPEFEVTLDTALNTIHPEDRKVCAEQIELAIALHRDYEHNVRVQRRDGGTSHIITRGFCEIGEDGNVSAVFGTVIDMTKLKEAELRLEAARLAAERANQAKSDFLSSMSHELRTPLTSIIGFADVMLMQKNVSEELKPFLKLQREAGQHLLTMINDILDHSKIEAGKLQLEAIPFDLPDLIASCCESLKLEAGRKSLELSYTVPVTVPRMIVGDPARLRQIILNLLSNALKFTAEGGVSLSVDLTGEAGEVAALRFAVRDTGIGIPSDKLSRLFQRFSQADSSTTRQFGGTGLGLAISKNLVEAMGGSMSVESTPGQGSVFSFDIRALIAHARMPEEAAVPAVKAPARSCHILLADDSAANQLLFSEILKLLGHKVKTVDNGLLAVEAIRRESFDIVLMDMQMPVMDGLTATQTIRAHHNKTVPIVGLTANAGEQDIERCLKAGMNGHLAKPVDIPALVAMIDRMVPSMATA